MFNRNRLVEVNMFFVAVIEVDKEYGTEPNRLFWTPEERV